MQERKKSHGVLVVVVAPEESDVVVSSQDFGRQRVVAPTPNVYLGVRSRFQGCG